MAFVRANPGGWAVGAQLTSAQQNALDIDHANALDKTSAGDTIAGLVNFTGAGSIRANTVGAIQSTIAAGIEADVASGIASVVAGGFLLSGGSTDWPQFGGANRSRSLVASPKTLAPFPTGWTATNGIDFTGPATGTPIVWLIQTLHHQATLSTVNFVVLVNGPHGALPANLPSVQLRRVLLTSGAETIVDLSTTPQQSPTPGSAAAWDNSGNVQFITYTTNQNNVIDTTSYKYYAVVTDESGANSVSGNRYIALILNFTNIADMHFP
jgi:hypothetical protein